MVINIQKFDPHCFSEKHHAERVWSETDVESLRTNFEYLEFEFILCENLKARELISTIQGISSIHAYLTDVDCFLCVVMYHGCEDKIMVSGNIEVSFKEMAPIKPGIVLFSRNCT